jgi:hypothetical protein
MPETIAVKAPRAPRNGVQTPDLLATINVVKESPRWPSSGFAPAIDG